MEQLRVYGLSKYEQKQLQQMLADAPMEIVPEPLASDRHQDLATVSVIIAVSIPALAVLALWVSRGSREVTVERTETTSSGTIVTNRYTLRSKEAISAAAIGKLAEIFKVDFGKLLKLIEKLGSV
jgi:hypothetical protein